MTAVTYHPSIGVHAVAQVIALIITVLALAVLPVLVTTIAPYIFPLLCAVAKTAVIAAVAASPAIAIHLQKGKA